MPKVADKTLLEEIDVTFPVIDMPINEEITIHRYGCPDCDDLRKDIELYRDKYVDEQLIRSLHQELYNLSEKTWRWILPHYLKYCISLEGQDSHMETEYLVYNFSPSNENLLAAKQRFSFLNDEQLQCVSHFIDWCIGHPYWSEYFPDDLQRAKKFLQQRWS